MGKASYFSHDSNARNDEKILAVRMRHKSDGYATYFMLLERLREATDYLSIKDYNMLAFDFRVSAEVVKSVVEDFGLFEFTDDGKYFYSLSFLERMKIKDENAKKRSEAGRKGMESRWGKQSNNNVITNNNNETNSDNKPITSKVKKSKGKESKEEVYGEIIDFFNENCVSLPSVKLTPKRRGNIRARIREHSIPEVYEMLKNAGASSFLAGQNRRDWQATFDWLFRPNNFVKVLEGNYKDKNHSEPDFDPDDTRSQPSMEAFNEKF